MRATSSALLLLLAAALTQGLPAKDKKDEVEIITPHRSYGDQPIVDTGAFFGESSGPFDGLFSSLEGIMTRLREQMDSLLRRIPGRRSNETEGTDFGIAGDFPGFPSIHGIDLGKGNTTSVTKVIDGHKVVINETEYKKEDDFGGAFFKVRIIDVKPDSSELTTEREAEEVTRDRELVENSSENEIPKSKEVEDRIESLEEDAKRKELVNREWDDVDAIETLDDNSIDGVDLSNDIRVNEILANRGAPVNPDAEVFYVPPKKMDPR